MTSDLRQQGFHAVCHDLRSTLFMCRGQQKIWQPCCQGLDGKNSEDEIDEVEDDLV